MVDLNEKKILHILPALTDSVRVILLTDKWFYVSGADPIIRAWDYKLKKTKEYVGHQGWVYVLKVHEDLLFSGGDDKTVKVWDLESAILLDELVGHENGVTQLEVANGELFSGSYDHTIICWDIAEIRQQIEERKEMLAEEELSQAMEDKMKGIKRPVVAKKTKAPPSKKPPAKNMKESKKSKKK